MRQSETLEPFRWILHGLLMVAAAGTMPLGAADAPAKPADPPTLVRTILFGSCFDQRRDAGVWDVILAAKPDVFMMLGDNVYADTEDMAAMKAAYDKLGAVASFEKLRRSCPLLATWDDHDYGKNDAGAEFPKRAEAQQVFMAFFETPAGSPPQSREGVYDSVIYGPPGRRVQFILLDTRYFRGPLKQKPPDQRERDRGKRGPYVPNADSTALMLGEAQWRWLEEQLQKPADVRILASSVQILSEEHAYEGWMNLPLERQRMFDLIKKTGASGVIAITGDRHSAELSKSQDAVGYPLYELTSSSLNRGRKPVDEPNHYRLGGLFFEENFGVISIDWERADPGITLEIRKAAGETLLRHEVALSELTSRGKQ